MNGSIIKLSHVPLAPGPHASKILRAFVPSVSKRPQVIVATINRPTGDTGVHTHTRMLHEGIAAAGIPSVVLSPFSGGKHWLPIFALRRLFGPFNRSASTAWYRKWHQAALMKNLLDHLGRNDAAAVIAQCPVSAAAALEARSRLGLHFPVALVCHFNFSEAKEYRDKGELSDEASYQAVLESERKVLTQVDQVIYVSQWAQRVVEEERGIRPRHSSVIWNGVGEAIGRPVSRAEIGLAKEDIVLMNVGTLEARKNQFGLLDLFAPLAQENPNARLVLVGDGPARSEIEQKIKTLELSDKVKLLGFRQDVAALLPAADLYVHYASMENCPVVLIEAARAGLPIAALATGGVPELLDALGGVTLTPDNPAEARQTVSELLSDSAVRAQLGSGSRKSYERSFTREAMVAAYLRALGLAKMPLRARPRTPASRASATASKSREAPWNPFAPVGADFSASRQTQAADQHIARIRAFPTPQFSVPSPARGRESFEVAQVGFLYCGSTISEVPR